MREWFGGYVLFALLLPCCSTTNETKSDLGSKVQRRGGGGDRKESELRDSRGLYGFGNAFWLWSGCDEPLVLPGVVPDGTLACPWIVLLLWVGCCRSSPPKWTGVGICGGEEEDIFSTAAYLRLLHSSSSASGVVNEDEDVGEG